MTVEELNGIKESVDKLSKTMALIALVEVDLKITGSTIYVNKKDALKRLVALHDIDRVLRG